MHLINVKSIPRGGEVLDHLFSSVRQTYYTVKTRQAYDVQ